MYFARGANPKVSDSQCFKDSGLAGPKQILIKHDIEERPAGPTLILPVGDRGPALKALTAVILIWGTTYTPDDNIQSGIQFIIIELEMWNLLWVKCEMCEP